MASRDELAKQCYRRATDAMNKGNWDLAAEHFGTCVKLKPDLLNYRQLLRQTTKKRYDDNGKGAGRLAKTKLIGIRSKIKKAKAKEDWEEVCTAAEEGLYLNPWDVGLNVELAEACAKLQRTEVARFAYMEACKAAPKDKDLHKSLGNLLEERREYDDAIKIWSMILQIDDEDIEARKKIVALQTQKTTDRGGYEHAANTKDVMTDRQALQKSGQEYAPQDDQETALKHAIRKEPDKVPHYQKLAAFYKSRKQLDEAHKVMKTALEVSGDDPNVGEQVEDIELLLLKQSLDAAKEKANTTGDDLFRKQAAQLSQEYRQRQIEILTAREQRYPANLNVKLNLAELLMQRQEWATAIPLLQRAGTDPRLKVKALVNLGKCFVYDQKLPLAKGQFERALPDLDHELHPETYKECHYLLARVYEDMSDTENAIKHYGEVIVLDYDYRDARQRMEKLQAG